MSLLDRILAAFRSTSSDEAYYAYVVEELKLSGLRTGLWAKALTLAGADEPRARALYMQMRVEQLMAKAPDLFDLIGRIAALRAAMGASRDEAAVVERNAAEALEAASRADQDWAQLTEQLNALEPAVTRRNRLRMVAAALGCVAAATAAILADIMRHQSVQLGAAAWGGIACGGLLGAAGAAVAERRSASMRALAESKSGLSSRLIDAQNQASQRWWSVYEVRARQRQLADTLRTLESDEAKACASLEEGIA